jgi:hypothetical protein
MEIDCKEQKAKDDQTIRLTKNNEATLTGSRIRLKSYSLFILRLGIQHQVYPMIMK